MTYLDIYNGIPYGMSGMTKVQMYERFLHTPIVTRLIDAAFTRQHSSSSRHVLSGFL
jgi:hypothetical protein